MIREIPGCDQNFVLFICPKSLLQNGYLSENRKFHSDIWSENKMSRRFCNDCMSALFTVFNMYSNHKVRMTRLLPCVGIGVVVNITRDTTQRNFEQTKNMRKGLFNDYVTLSCLCAKFHWLISHVQLSFQPGIS